MPRYIDADALIEEITTLQVMVTGMRSGKGFLSEFMNEYRKSVLRIIDEQPTADVVPSRTAYWVEVRSSNPAAPPVHRCSNPDCRLTTYAHRLPPYCQECGSKMIGKVKEDDENMVQS